MKNLLTILCFVLITSTITAQKFQGKAIYKTHRKMDMKLGGSEFSNMSDEKKAQMIARMMKQFQKTFTLTFDASKSIYKEEKSLKAPVAAPSNGMNGMNVMVMGDGGGNDVLYKNIKEDQFINKTEIMGKLFLIKDELPKYDWKLTGETKNIGIYTCYKATYTRQEDRMSMSVEDGEVKESSKKVDVVTTAWYTPKIAVSNGPGEYTGLPGLILEIKEGNQTIVCSEIIMNPKEKIVIEKPRKGKVVSQDEYSKIMDKKMKEQMEQFKSRREKGKSIEMSIDG
jgi:GLPGLI family protein